MSSSHDITLTPQEQALIMRLKSFRVPEMAHILEEQLKDPNADLNTFMERMTAMVDAEWQARADKRFNRLMKEAHVDKIFVMSEGRICEEGQHNELMKKGEKYYALVQNL